MIKRIPKHDKGGVIWLIIGVLVLFIAASVFGFLFVNKAVDKINTITFSRNFIILVVITLVVIFREPVKALLMSVIGMVKR